MLRLRLASLLTVATLSFMPQLIQTAANAPIKHAAITSLEFGDIGERGFKYRWLTDQAINDGHLKCQMYSLCSFADLVGPSCPAELFVALDFFDQNGALISSGGDVLPSYGKRHYVHVELGTNFLDSFADFEVTDIGCYRGVPTGRADL
jgi:hypothetical protein